MAHLRVCFNIRLSEIRRRHTRTPHISQHLSQAMYNSLKSALCNIIAGFSDIYPPRERRLVTELSPLKKGFITCGTFVGFLSLCRD